MSPDPVNAPYAQTYAQHEPYLTADEYAASPSAVSMNQLVPGASPAVNKMAVNQLMVSASGWADQICNQVLAATVETVTGIGRVRPDGTMPIVVRDSPIVQVLGFAIGSDPTTQTAAATLAGIMIDRKVVTIPATLISAAGGSYSTLTYVAGYANAYLSAPITAGATLIFVDNALGIVAGMTLTINDPYNVATEVVTVSNVTGSAVNVVAPTTYAHAAGVNMSALPPAVKSAVTYLATALVKRRGAASFSIRDSGSQPEATSGFPAGGAEERTARTMLAAFSRIV